MRLCNRFTDISYRRSGQVYAFLGSQEQYHANGVVGEELGGAGRDRTDGLVVANDALSQLSYSPKKEARRRPRWNYCNKALQAVPCLTVKRLEIAYASATSNWDPLQGVSKLWPRPSLHISPTASSLAVSRYRTPWRCCSSRETVLPASRSRQSPE